MLVASSRNEAGLFTPMFDAPAPPFQVQRPKVLAEALGDREADPFGKPVLAQDARDYLGFPLIGDGIPVVDVRHTAQTRSVFCMAPSCRKNPYRW